MTGKPLYILTDVHTASSSEMFAYIAQKRKRLGTVVGETSPGMAGNIPAGSDHFFVPLSRVVDGPDGSRQA